MSWSRTVTNFRELFAGLEKQLLMLNNKTKHVFTNPQLFDSIANLNKLQLTILIHIPEHLQWTTLQATRTMTNCPSAYCTSRSFYIILISSNLVI